MSETTDAVSRQPNAADPAWGRDLVEAVLTRLAGRPPTDAEVSLWTARLGATEGEGKGAAGFLATLLAELPPPWVPAGALAARDPVAAQKDLVRAYVEASRAAAGIDLPGIDLPVEAMAAFLERTRPVLAATPFGGAGGAHRYDPAQGGAYPLADAVVLRAMIHDRPPGRIVSVGAASAVAALLDILDELALPLRPTVIDPSPRRLSALLRPGDEVRLDLIETPLQFAAPAPFAALGEGDLLLADTSHVLAAGSDVHHLLFHVLPVLAPGVRVQIAACRIPFEYTDRQLFELGRPWNEAYAVRALLTGNSHLSVLFSASALAALRPELLRAAYPPLARQPGGALWLVTGGVPAGRSAPVDLSSLAPLAARRPGAGRPSAPRSEAPHRTPAPPPRSPAHPESRSPASPDSRSPGETDKSGPRRATVTLTAGSATLPFTVLRGGSGPVFFSLGVRKSGSTMLHKIIALLARANGVNIVDVPGTFFRSGLTVADWAPLDLSPLMDPGNILTGFRNFPRAIGGTAAYRSGLKVFMHRDPRDAIVSQYFSDAFSHDLPDETAGDGRQRFLRKREEARASDIDAWVLRHAPPLARTLLQFRPVLSDPSALVVPYETYVFEKVALIAAILAHFGWTADAATVEAILAEVDVKPAGEDPTRFVRKATPGDHREKLKAETVAALDGIFAEPLALYGYPR